MRYARETCAKRARNVRDALRETRETCAKHLAKHAKHPAKRARNTTSHTISPPSGLRISLRLHFEASKVPLQPPQNDYHPLSSIFCQFQPLGTQSRPPTTLRHRRNRSHPPTSTARNSAKRARNVRYALRETREMCAKHPAKHAKHPAKRRVLRVTYWPPIGITK